jgi:ribosomal protein S18 acetylase RimI-like enzyme
MDISTEVPMDDMLRSLGFRTDLMLRRMAGSIIDERAAHLVVRTPANPGFWWGNFILYDAPPKPDDLPRRLAAFAQEFPDAQHVALGIDGTDGDTGDAAALTDLGLTAEVNTVLTAQRLPPGPADGTEVRPLTSDDDWAQATDLRLVCYYETPTPDERRFTELQVAGERGLCTAGYGTWFGAFVEGRMRAGAGMFTDGTGPARFQSVETHPDFRRRGLASAVIRHAGQWALHQPGARTLVIVADPDDHAIRLYRTLGFAETERQAQLYRAHWWRRGPFPAASC